MHLDRHISKTQIVWAAGTLLGLGMAVFVGSAIGNQDLQVVVLLLGVLATVGFFLFIGNNYWFAIPLSISVADLPIAPIVGRAVELPEFAIAACTMAYIIRVATRKDKLQVFTPLNTPILLYVAWALFIFTLHPIGFMALGAATAGGRFYVKLGLAFCAFIILSNRTYTQRDIKLLFGLTIAGSIVSAIWLFFKLTFFETTSVLNPTLPSDGESSYSWHQGLTGPAMAIVYVIFSRWSPRDVFGLQRPWAIVCYAGSILLVLLSGKRMAIPAMLLPPLLGAFIHKQYRYLVIFSVLGSASIAFLVAGHGQFFQLPYTTQRALSFLPGDWDSDLYGIRGGADEWRAELRRIAWEMALRKPIFGEGFSMDVNEVFAASTMTQQGGEMDIQVATYALGRAWHNRWIGYAADFGFPLSVLLAVIYIVILVISSRTWRSFGSSNWLGTFAIYVFLITCKDIMASHTSGHSAVDPFMTWWMYGMLFALYAQSRSAIFPTRRDASLHRQKWRQTPQRSAEDAPKQPAASP